MKATISQSPHRAFSLLEVMIAIAIFFVASFAILGLVSTSLSNVRRLQKPTVDATAVLAWYAATNGIEEGIRQGSLGEPELLGKDYRNYNYRAEVVEIASNHLFGVTVDITEYGRRDVISHMSSVFYRPLSNGSLDAAPGMRGH